MHRLLMIVFLLMSTSALYAQTVTLSTLLDEMADVDSITRYADFRCRQASSYDRRSKDPNSSDWFANADASQFIRKETNGGRDEWVLLDVQGPGAIVRWWITAPHYKNNFYVYIDEAVEPVFSGSTAAMIGGTKLTGAPLSAERSRGRDLYLPIPFAKHIKITCDQMPLQKNLYYQIVYRTYPKNVSVESASQEGLVRCAAQIDRVQRLLADDFTPLSADDLKKSGAQIRSDFIDGSKENIMKIDGPAVISELTLKTNAGDLAQTLRSALLSIRFDGEETVLCPLGDFFGSGVGVNSYKSRYAKVAKDGTMTARWPMPFKKSAEIQLILPKNSKGISINRSVVWKPQIWQPQMMYFHASWHQDRLIETLAGQGTKDWNYLTVSGKGHYAGDVLSVLNRSNQWWGEGDEKIYVDHEKFPSHFGTGTEDYYGYAWCCPEFFEAPFHAQPRAEGPGNFGHTTVLRYRALDTIPFENNFKFDIEIWHWAKTKIDYAVTAFWYAFPGAKDLNFNRNRVLNEAGQKVVRNTPFESNIAGMKILAMPKSGRVTEQNMKSFRRTGHVWNSDRQIWWTGGEIGDSLVLSIRVPQKKAFELELGLTAAVDYGKFQILIDGRSAAQEVDLFIPKNVERKIVRVPVPDLAPGEHKLTFKLIGKHEKSIGTMFGIDSFQITER